VSERVVGDFLQQAIAVGDRPPRSWLRRLRMSAMTT
jgi:hypothetical protein